jgi:hypothetical protein
LRKGQKVTLVDAAAFLVDAKKIAQRIMGIERVEGLSS